MSRRYDLRNLTPQQRAIITIRDDNEKLTEKSTERNSVKRDEEEKLRQKLALTFYEIWKVILRQLKPGELIPNWTVLKGYLGDSMKVVQVYKREIIVQAPNAKRLQHVSRGEFENIWAVWPAYKTGQKQRQEIREMTFHSKYILSILHWLEENKF
jgi:hypothetical protein